MESDPNLALAVVALVVAAATALVAAVQTWRTRPRSPVEGPATMDLLDEPPPAIVDLVTDGFEVTPEAVPATLCDLAARRWLSIEEVGHANVVIRLGRRDGKGDLLPYERQVLDHMHRLAVDGVVPAEAMTTGPDGVSSSWWRRFRNAVVADAQHRGLCRNRWRFVDLVPVGLGAALTAAVLIVANAAGDERPSFEPVPRNAVVASAVLIVGVGAVAGLVWWLSQVYRGHAQRETDRGLQVASHWLGVRRWMDEVGDFADKPAASVTLWEGYLAYAVALDLAHTATVQLPLGAEDDHHAWSRAAGHWRHVRVRYPRWRVGWGKHPLWSTAQALVIGGFAAVGIWFALRVGRDQIDLVTDLDDRPHDLVHLVALVVAAALLIPVLWSLVQLVRSVPDLFDTRTVEGQVIRQRRRRGFDRLPGPLGTIAGFWKSDDADARWYVAVDDGSASIVRAWKVTEEMYVRSHQGDVVRVRYTPRVGRVKDIEVLRSTAAPPAATVAVTPVNDIAAQAAEFVERYVGGARRSINNGGTP